jgi:hypothetical protein
MKEVKETVRSRQLSFNVKSQHAQSDSLNIYEGFKKKSNIQFDQLYPETSC